MLSIAHDIVVYVEVSYYKVHRLFNTYLLVALCFDLYIPISTLLFIIHLFSNATNYFSRRSLTILSFFVCIIVLSNALIFMVQNFMVYYDNRILYIASFQGQMLVIQGFILCIIISIMSTYIICTTDALEHTLTWIYLLFWLDVMTNELFKSSFALDIKMRLCGAHIR